MTTTGLIPDLTSSSSALDRVLTTVASDGFWKRTGVIAVGSALVLIGTILAFSGTRAVKDATKLVTGVASKVVTKGAV